MKKIIKIFTFLLLGLVFSLSIMMVSSCQKNDEIEPTPLPDNNGEDVGGEEGDGGGETPVVEDPYVEMFSADNAKTDARLLTLADYLALNCFNNETKTKTILTTRGFSQIQCDSLQIQNDPYGIASVIAKRALGDEELVLVAIRGINYYQEWISNFTAGLEGDIAGFAEALQKIVIRLDDYLANNNITNFKILVSGYSRGGGVANLLGVYLNENLAKYNLDKDDLFVYTFEAPHSSTSNKVYDNIINVYNENDLVTYVYPDNEGWDIYLNGLPYIIKEAQMIRSYYDFSFEEGKYLRVDKYMSMFLEQFTRRVDRETYVENVQPLVLYALDLYYNRQTTFNKLFDFIKNDLVPYFSNLDNLPSLLKINIQMIKTYHSEHLYNRALSSVEKILDEKIAGKNILSASEWENFKALVFDALKAVVPVLIDDLKYRENLDYEEYYRLIEPLYDLGDVERGVKQGSADGMKKGYTDGIENTTSTKGSTSTLFGDEYVAAYDETYAIYYEIGKELGSSIRDNLQARGLYDGEMNGTNDGIDHGSRGLAYGPNLLIKGGKGYKDWMSDEYLDAYNDAYLSAYEKEFQERHDFYVALGPELPLYHIATMIKNVDYLISNHDGDYNSMFLGDTDA